MSRDVSRAPLYRGVINLWVEDEATRAYLATVWNDPDVAFLIAGGNEGVKAIVNDAGKAGYTNVFGLIDRDFGSSNKSAWFEQGKTFRTFVLPVHEIENYFLDAEALAGCRSNNLGKSATEIAGLLQKEADRRVWWAACGVVVGELRKRFRDGFIQNPRCPPVENESEARRHISEHAWFKGLAVRAAQTNEDEIKLMLAQAHQDALVQLSNGTWRVEFSGREVLRDIGSRICDQTKQARERTQSEFDSDLAKEVGEWQITQNKVPSDLTDLLAALKRRIET